jgi:hypothetical protein
MLNTVGFYEASFAHTKILVAKIEQGIAQASDMAADGGVPQRASRVLTRHCLAAARIGASVNTK